MQDVLHLKKKKIRGFCGGVVGGVWWCGAGCGGGVGRGCDGAVVVC